MLFAVLLRQLFNYITVSFLCQAFFKSFFTFFFQALLPLLLLRLVLIRFLLPLRFTSFCLTFFKLLSSHSLVECFIIIAFISGVVNSNLLQFFHHNLSIYYKTKKRSSKSSSFINTILIMCYLIDRDYDC